MNHIWNTGKLFLEEFVVLIVICRPVVSYCLAYWQDFKSEESQQSQEDSCEVPETSQDSDWIEKSHFQHLHWSCDIKIHKKFYIFLETRSADEERCLFRLNSNRRIFFFVIEPDFKTVGLNSLHRGYKGNYELITWLKTICDIDVIILWNPYYLL